MLKIQYLVLALIVVLSYIGVSSVYTMRDRTRLLAKIKSSIDKNGNGELTALEVAHWLSEHSSSASSAQDSGLAAPASCATGSGNATGLCALFDAEGLEQQLVNRFDRDGSGVISDDELLKLSDAVDDLPAPPKDMVDLMVGDDNLAFNDALFLGALAFSFFFLVAIFADSHMLSRKFSRQELLIKSAGSKEEEAKREKAEMTLKHRAEMDAVKAEHDEMQAEIDRKAKEFALLSETLKIEQAARDVEAQKMNAIIRNMALSSSSASRDAEAAAAKVKLSKLEDDNRAAAKHQKEEGAAVARLQEILESSKAQERARQDKFEADVKAKDVEIGDYKAKVERLVAVHAAEIRNELCDRLKDIARRFPGDALKYRGYQGDESSENQEQGFNANTGFLNDALGFRVSGGDKPVIVRRGLSSVGDPGFTVDIFGSEDNSRIYVGVKFLGSGKTGACVVQDLNDRSKEYVMKKYAIADADRDHDLKKELWAKEIPPHENVCKYEKAIITRFTGYVLMEKCAGTDWLTNTNPSKPSATTESVGREAFRQLMSGLKHLHDNGVLHCDVKPENIMIDVSGSSPIVKIIDMGYAHYCRKPQAAQQQEPWTTGMNSLHVRSRPGRTLEEQGHYDDIYRGTMSLWIMMGATYDPYERGHANAARFSDELHDLMTKISKEEWGTDCAKVLSHPWLRGGSGSKVATGGGGGRP